MVPLFAMPRPASGSTKRAPPDEDSIRRPDHWDAFFAARKRWAAEEGYDPAVIEAVYRSPIATVQVALVSMVRL